mgnify:CR=1 FL=1
MAYNIYLIDDDNEIYKCITKLFQKEKEYKIHKAKTNQIEGVLKDIPSLIIINEDGVDEDTIKICDSIRGDENNIITPIIVISSNHDKDHRVKILKAGVEHYIKAPIDEEYMYYTIVNAIRLLYTNRGISPLTGLPGNIQIQTEIKRRLLNKEDFCVIYLDLDNFKAYNDVYGFLNGDEIIKFTAKTTNHFICIFSAAFCVFLNIYVPCRLLRIFYRFSAGSFFDETAIFKHRPSLRCFDYSSCKIRVRRRILRILFRDPGQSWLPLPF